MTRAGQREKETYPPLKAPTGLRTGSTTSAILREEVWKLRVVRRAEEGEERERMAGERMRAAILM